MVRAGACRKLGNLNVLPYSCQSCRRAFATTAMSQAGHNKWSKNKHIKAVVDKKKSKERHSMANTITVLSKLFGENLQFNPQLAHALSLAAKASVPKAVVEGAIARGQGRSTSGVSLESVTIEAFMAPNIALIAECETDNKIRTLHDVRHAIKDGGGLSSATAFYFTKRGRIVFRAKEGGPSLSDMLEEAIEQGAEDVEETSDGNFVVWTEPPMCMAVTQAFAQKHTLEILEADIVYAPNEETTVSMDDEVAAETLAKMLTLMREILEVKAVYTNVRQGSLSDDSWESIETNINV